MFSRSKKNRNVDMTQRSQMYLDSKEARNHQCKILSGVGLISIVLILVLHKIGLFSSKENYIIGATTQKIEESTNKILSAWGSTGEALKFSNLPSTAQGYVTVNAMVIQQDKSVKKEDIQIFYREASKLNPGGFGIVNKLQRLHSVGHELIGGIAHGMAITQKSMNEYVVDKDVTLIFLHGKDYASSTWQELGTLDYFADIGYKIYGIDMPGYGHSQKVSVKTNEWLMEIIIKLISSQDEEGNIDEDGGEHHTDSHEKNNDAIKNDVAPSTKKIHKIAIISPDISGLYTLELLRNHKEKLGEKQGLILEKFIAVSMDISHITTKYQSADVQICNIVGQNDVNLQDEKIFNDMENAQTVTIEGASKHVYLDEPDIFHEIIARFLATDQCAKKLDEEYKTVKQDLKYKAAEAPV